MDFEDPFDLDNLRFYDAEEVKALLKHMEKLVEQKSTVKMSAVIGKGGTIAMSFDEKEGGLVPKLQPKQIAQFAGGDIERQIEASPIEFPKPIDSSGEEIDYLGDLVIVMSWMYKNMSTKLKKKFVGFVVTHGTDTLAQSSAATQIMLGDAPFSVAFTGSQKTTEKRFSDAGNSYKLACEALLELDDAGVQSTVVAMKNIYLPVGSEKISDEEDAAFDSPLHPPIIRATNFNKDGIAAEFFRKRREFVDKVGLDTEKEWCPIVMRGYNDAVIPFAPTLGANPKKIYETIVNDRTAIAVALTTFGSFTSNPKIRRAIQVGAQRSAKKKIVVAANPFPGGGTDHDYREARKLVSEIGAHPTHMMPDSLLLALMFYEKIYGNDREAIARAITQHDLVGEQPSLRKIDGTPRFPEITVQQAVRAYRRKSSEILFGHPIETLRRHRTWKDDRYRQHRQRTGE